MWEVLAKEISISGCKGEGQYLISKDATRAWKTSWDAVTMRILLLEEVYVSNFEVHFWLSCLPQTTTVWYSTRDTGCDWLPLAVNERVIKEEPDGSVYQYSFEGVRMKEVLIDFDGGKLDPVYNHYRLGLYSIRFYSDMAPSPGLDLGDLSSSNSEVHTIRSAAQKSPWLGIQRVFAFPATSAVLPLMYQTRRSPWLQVSAKSDHRERVRKLLPDETSRYILPRLCSPTHQSVPSKGSFFQQHGLV